MSALHTALSWPLIIVNAMVAFWALAAHTQVNLRTAWLWRVTAVAHGLLFAHALVGGIVVATDDRDISGTHMFYGFLVLTVVSILYGYRRQLAEWLHLLYGVGGLFVVGLALRTHWLEPWAATGSG